MDDLHLSEPLLRYFSDVFLCCDDDKSGSASLHLTFELFKSTNIPEDVITQIDKICWTNPTHQGLTRIQFYSALKLVAAYQANLKITSDLLYAPVELPLPRFNWPIDFNECKEEAKVVGTSHSSIASDSLTPTNSIQDHDWNCTKINWHGPVSEDQCQLLEEESSDRHTSDEDIESGTSRIWTINNEQWDYYTNQFKTLEPNPNVLLSGAVARQFFEKSRLPIHELRHIWQLADITKDGALSLHEFNIAMHLVVLRRNQITLPNCLPQTLRHFGRSSPLTASRIELDPSNSSTSDISIKQWTKFTDSPVHSSESQPVNFDFKKVTIDKDANIYQPVPLRVTPETVDVDSTQADCDDANATMPARESANGGSSAIQRPQPKKIPSLGRGAIPPPPPSASNTHLANSDGPTSLPVFPSLKPGAVLPPPPPPPPPRIYRSHGRSSSLDLSRVIKPSTAPPRVSPTLNCPTNTADKLGGKQLAANASRAEVAIDYADNTLSDDLYELEANKVGLPNKHRGAFKAYCKPFSRQLHTKCTQSHIDGKTVSKWEQYQKLQEENAILIRICQELSQELNTIKEDNLSLKLKLEKQVSNK